MLVKYKKTFEKIAMGLISLMPKCKDSKYLMDIVHHYEQATDRQLYLWKKDEEFVGIIGVAVEGSTATIQHISILPSYHGEGITAAMLEELRALGQYDSLQYNDETAPFLQHHLSNKE
ncbi:GNAT family N-acetyltransferase [Bacillus ndiopicus]|uniref:GNAT family N-acetyltransferase n=1 Tax=Bacillus ndiopicus TaxID=1347368 RepID=UPI0005A749EE|nr:GNAT family N-acetyltransferase [Bacillus ndiopicus]